MFRTPADKWKKDFITEKGNSQDISIMIWAAIFGTEVLDAYILERDFEAKKHGYSANSYIKVLEDNIASC